MYCGVPSESPVCVMRAPPALETASAIPEVRDDRLPGLNENVLGLEVAVNDAARVRVVERVGDSDRDAHRLVDRELLLTLEPMPQALAFDVRHDVVQQPARFAGIEQRQQVGMLKCRGDADLA